MKKRQFAHLVRQAIRELPREFREKLKNVAILIEAKPPRDLCQRLQLPAQSTIFGLYEGVPLSERGFFEAPLYPDRIWIFQEPIESVFHTEDRIKEEVRRTIIHEVAHFFGIDDRHLEDLGY